MGYNCLMTEKNNTKDNGQPDKPRVRSRPTPQAESGVEAPATCPQELPPSKKIHLDKVEEMFQAWQVRQSATHVSKSCSVSRNTATKYIHHGDSSRNITSFKQRMSNRRRDQDRRVAVNLAEAENALLEATVGTLSVIRYALIGFGEQMKNKERLDIDVQRIPAMLKDLGSLIRYTSGDPNAKKEVEDKYAGWTLPELTEYYLHGVKPDRCKDDPNGPRFEKPKNLN